MHGFIKRKVGVLFKVVIILLIFALVVTGCKDKYKLQKGFDYTFTPEDIMFGARSDTNTFSKDCVILDIYYGFYDFGYIEEYGIDPKSSYRRKGEAMFFGLYICAEEHCLDIMNDMDIPDYKAIDAYYFVKEISEEEAFAEEYGFRMSYWKGITYNHSEKITIPAEFFVGEKGSFVVKLIAFRKSLDEEKIYKTSRTNYIKFDYEVIDENKVKIKF